MARAGRKRTGDKTVMVQLTLSKEVDQALENILNTGFYGRSKSEIVTALLSREFERLARESMITQLDRLSRLSRL